MHWSISLARGLTPLTPCKCKTEFGPFPVCVTERSILNHSPSPLRQGWTCFFASGALLWNDTTFVRTLLAGPYLQQQMSSFTIKFIFHVLFISVKPQGLMVILHTLNSHGSLA